MQTLSTATSVFAHFWGMQFSLNDRHHHIHTVSRKRFYQQASLYSSSQIPTYWIIIPPNYEKIYRHVQCGRITLPQKHSMTGFVICRKALFQAVLGHIKSPPQFYWNYGRLMTKNRNFDRNYFMGVQLRFRGNALLYRDHENHLLPGIKIPPGISPWWLNENELLVDWQTGIWKPRFHKWLLPLIGL